MTQLSLSFALANVYRTSELLKDAICLAAAVPRAFANTCSHYHTHTYVHAYVCMYGDIKTQMLMTKNSCLDLFPYAANCVAVATLFLIVVFATLPVYVHLYVSKRRRRGKNKASVPQTYVRWYILTYI